MAINADNAGLTTIDSLVDDLEQNEPLTARKANTVTTAVGGVATLLLTFLTYWAESGTDNLPSWLPMLVVMVGMVATTYGVSQTKNGITHSVADRLHGALAVRIDDNHFHESVETVASVAADAIPVIVEESERQLKNKTFLLREIADSLIADRTE